MTFNFTNFKFSSDEIEEAAKRIYYEFISNLVMIVFIFLVL